MASADEVLDGYEAWLVRQALAGRTRTAYRRWVRELVEHLVARGDLQALLAPAGDDDRRAIVADWRRRLVDRRLAPSTVKPGAGRGDVVAGLARVASAERSARRG